MKVNPTLPKATTEFVSSKVNKFNEDNETVERALGLLIEQFGENSDLAHVLLKVATINSLYSTQIRGIYKVAERIKECCIDADLNDGIPDVVDAIAMVDFNGKARCNYSFASKYCSWHKPEFYPIYDSRVEFCLRAYKQQDNFFSFQLQELWKYSQFCEVMRGFRSHYQLESFNFKEIDKFLYELGNEHFYAGESSQDSIRD